MDCLKILYGAVTHYETAFNFSQTNRAGQYIARYNQLPTKIKEAQNTGD